MSSATVWNGCMTSPAVWGPSADSSRQSTICNSNSTALTIADNNTGFCPSKWTKIKHNAKKKRNTTTSLKVGGHSSGVPWPLRRQQEYSSQSQAVALNHVGGRPHHSPRVLLFASAIKAPKCIGCYLFTDTEGMEGWVGWLMADALPTKWSNNRLPAWLRIRSIADQDRNSNHYAMPPSLTQYVHSDTVKYVWSQMTEQTHICKVSWWRTLNICTS